MNDDRDADLTLPFGPAKQLIKYGPRSAQYGFAETASCTAKTMKKNKPLH
jgi:hypothetical protein